MIAEDKKPPCYGQTENSIKAWMKANVAVGTKVVVRNSQGGLLQYALATVVRIGKSRFEVDSLGHGNVSGGGRTFYYSGKNCWAPKGQTRLVEPTPEVLAVCDRLPGALGLSYPHSPAVD